MTESSGPSDVPPRRLDDPAWVDDIVASAVARVTGNGTAEPKADTAQAGVPSPTAPTKNGVPKPSGPGKRIVARPRTAVGASTVAPTTTREAAPRPVPASLVVARTPDTTPRAQPRNGAVAQPRLQAAAAAIAVADPPAPAITPASAPRAPVQPDELIDDVDEDATPDTEQSSPARGVLEWIVVIGGALLVAVLIKTFLFQAFYIPSGSMLPTLQIDDRVLVNKLSYDLHDVNRGDLVVFERPEDGDPTAIDDLIKRVIGLPGDTVEVRDSVVYVNGGALDEPYLPAGLEFGDAPPVVVPDDHVFVMGDNRPDSRDSRVFGPVPVDDIVGRAFFRIWPLTNIGFL